MENFSIDEKVVIARAHLVVTILKLKPNNKFNIGAYKGIRGHIVFLPQNRGQLLILLLFDFASFEDIIHIIWLGSTLSQCKDLQKFIFIRKQQIIKVLE